MEWLDTWKPDMFAKPNLDGPQEYPKPIDIVAKFKGLRLLTWDDAQDMYISEMLGQLNKNGFIFKQDLSRGWGQLSQDELFVLITYCKANMVLLESQKVRSQLAKTPPPQLSPEEKAKAQKRAAGMLSYNAEKAKRRQG